MDHECPGLFGVLSSTTNPFGHVSLAASAHSVGVATNQHGSGTRDRLAKPAPPNPKQHQCPPKITPGSLGKTSYRNVNRLNVPERDSSVGRHTLRLAQCAGDAKSGTSLTCGATVPNDRLSFLTRRNSGYRRSKAATTCGSKCFPESATMISRACSAA